MSDVEKNKGGRPRFFDNPDNVQKLEQLLTIHCNQEECAAVLGCCVDTIKRYAKERCPEEGFAGLFRAFSAGGKASLRRALYKKAVLGEEVASSLKFGRKIMKTDTQAMLFLAKNWLGMSDGAQVTIPEAKITLNYKDD